jgi:hypothetical protein
MTIDERRKYLKRMWPRYWAANRPQRSELLDEMQAVTGYDRKYLIRLIRGGELDRKRRTTGRGRTYGADVRHAVSVVWKAMDYVCAERLTPCLTDMARHLQRFDELSLTAETEEKLGRISVSTVQRMIRRMPREKPRLPRNGSDPGNGVRREIPMRRLPWDEQMPGHFEVDMVHHCGQHSGGQYAHTLQLVDVATGWSERMAILGRSQHAVGNAMLFIQRRLPFPILQLHPDNGSEFLNNHLVRLLGQEITGLKLTRSRPYQKNDNRFVEQKNGPLVRGYFGNDRIDTLTQVLRMNVIYERLWIYNNLFQPSLRLIGKEIVNGKLRKRWDEAATPYQRLVRSGVLDNETKARLDEIVARTNPMELRRQIYRDIAEIWTTPNHNDQPQNGRRPRPDPAETEAWRTYVPVTFSNDGTES